MKLIESLGIIIQLEPIKLCSSFLHDTVMWQTILQTIIILASSVA